MVFASFGRDGRFWMLRDGCWNWIFEWKLCLVVVVVCKFIIVDASILGPQMMACKIGIMRSGVREVRARCLYLFRYYHF